MDGDRLRILRLARGMSLDDLAEANPSMVSKQMLSRYERGLSMPTPKVLMALASALGVPVSRLLEAPPLRVEPVAYRKRASLNKGDQHRITSVVTMALQQRVRLQEANGFPALKLPILDVPIEDVAGAEAAAERVRKTWSLGEAPIMSLVDEMESRLVHVIEIDTEEKFDGLSLVARDEKQRATAVGAAVRRGVSGDRQRFSLAHELGHILLSIPPTVNEEDAANRFASSLLAPASALRREVGEQRSSINLGELAILKSRYKMSLQAIVYRLKDLGIISENHAKHWWIQIRSRGWQKTEPWPIAREEPTWLRSNVHRAVSEGTIRRDEAREMLGADLLEVPESTSERMELMKMTREERRRLLEESVAKSVDDYEVEADWVDSPLEERPAKDGS